MHPDRHESAANQPRRRPRIAPVHFLIAALSAIAIVLVLPSPASAQPALWATSPEDGAALDTAPGEIAATYSATLDPSASEVAVTGPDQAPIELEPPVVSDNVLIQPMRYTEPGAYTITINAVFADGQRFDQSFTFSVESIPDMLSAADIGSEAADPDPSAATAADGSGTSIVVIAGVVLLAAAAGFLLARQLARRRVGDR